jgi:ribosomal protein L7Ae-like RNA K-turn-binding protein
MTGQVYGKESDRLLGLAKKAGKLASGSAQVEALLTKQLRKPSKGPRGYLLVIAQDAPGLIKKFEHQGQKAGIPVMLLSDKEELGRSIGSAPSGVLLVLDQNLAQAMINAQGIHK